MDPEKFYRDYLGIDGRASSNGWFRACCPIHGENNPSFGVNLNYPYNFNCFSCGKKGQLPYLVALLKGKKLEEAAQIVREKVDVKIELERLYRDPSKRLPSIPAPILQAYKAAMADSVVLDYLRFRSVPRFAAETFDAGFDQLDNRMVIPVRGVFDGRPLGFDTVSFEGTFNETAKRIIIPPEYKGKIVATPQRFRKYPGCIVCEGVIDAMKIFTWLIRQSNTTYIPIALCGSSVSDDHLRLLSSYDRIVFAMDKDSAGERATKFMASRISGLHVYKLDFDGEDPGESSLKSFGLSLFLG